MDPSVTEYLQVALLAVIQGAAELLPVSSSAHVIFAQHLMGKNPASPEATFLLVMLHTGTMGAVLVYFWPRWKRLLSPAIPAPAAPAPAGTAISLTPTPVGATMPARHFLAMVVVATIATGILGLGLQLLIEKVIMERMLGYEKGEVELMFRELPLVAGALFAAGVVIFAAGLAEKRAVRPALTSRDSVLIGLVQGLCLPFRGFSRSGATISTALFCGVSRPLAEDFSFALAVVLTPPVIVKELYRLWKNRGEGTEGQLLSLVGPGIAGMVLSFLAGLVALRLLSAALEGGRWRYFGVYCVVASAVLFGYAYAK
jgi:undecaprenyl-diphosphatase